MEIVLPKNFDAEDASRVLDRAREVLDLPPDARLRVENVTRNPRGVRIDFTYTKTVSLNVRESHEVDGVQVEVSSRGELRFNSSGTLVAYEVEPADPGQLQAVEDHIAKLIAAGQVYIAEPGEQVDPDKLRTLGKSWYLEQDAQGNKFLRRGWIS